MEKLQFPYLYVLRKLKVRWDESTNGDYDKSSHNKVSGLDVTKFNDQITQFRRSKNDWQVGEIVEWSERGELREGWYGTSDPNYVGLVIGCFEIPEFSIEGLIIPDPSLWPELEEND
jgi:hypothetical protein